MAKTLYICYFGLREPLVQTQVIPYLLEIAKDGVAISLLTFEGNVAELESCGVAKLKDELAAIGIDWHWLKYHKRLSVVATAFDVFQGSRLIRNLLRTEKFDVLHARIHIPMLMAAIARRFSPIKPKLLFDIRGFFPEEYTDAGVWKTNGFLFRLVKRVERWLMKESDGFVVLTEKAREILFPESVAAGLDKLERPVEVIPCCVDFDRFQSVGDSSRENLRRTLGTNDRYVVAYVGSFGGWYLSDEMMDFFSAAKRSDPRLFALVLTQRDQEKVRNDLRDRGFENGDFLVKGVPPSEIGEYMEAADVSLSFIKPCYSKLSSSPTKLAEYLACGLPIISNRGVGDVDELIERNKVGVLLDDFRDESYLKALRQIKEFGNIREKCRLVARNEFDLTKIAGTRYRQVYRRMLGSHAEVHDR